MGRGFLDKEDWYQRRLFADHLRSVEVVRTFTEINQDQIILRGGSQGGGVVLMVNSLVDFPILATFADVPSHSCLENRVAEGTGSYQIIHQYLQEHPQAHEKLPRSFLILIVVTLFRKLKSSLCFCWESRSDMSDERFFPFLSSDKGKKSSQSVLEKRPWWR